MKRTNKQFISTTDKQTADILREYGYQELPKQGSHWVFVNKPEEVMFANDNTKIAYTDILTF